MLKVLFFLFLLVYGIRVFFSFFFVRGRMSDSTGGGHGSHDNGGGDHSPRSSMREQDRFLPIANIGRIMKKALPANGKIAKDAKDTVQECVSEFISFVTSEYELMPLLISFCWNVFSFFWVCFGCDCFFFKSVRTCPLFFMSFCRNVFFCFPCFGFRFYWFFLYLFGFDRFLL